VPIVGKITRMKRVVQHMTRVRRRWKARHKAVQPTKRVHAQLRIEGRRKEMALSRVVEAVAMHASSEESRVSRIIAPALQHDLQ
jgi:hypothetical protein